MKHESLEPGGIHRAKVAVLMPAYREARHIAELVQRVRRELETVLVVDDGSPDETSARAREAGAEVIRHPRNFGKGAALKTGFRILLERGFEFVLTMDGDGQHLPEDIGRFLVVAAETQAGIYLGNRMEAPRNMPALRRLANQFMSWQVSWRCGQPIPDSQCGFRLLHRDVMLSLFCESNAYDYETEMLFVASRAGHRIVSLPVTSVYADETSKIRTIRDGIRFAKLFYRYRR